MLGTITFLASLVVAWLLGVYQADYSPEGLPYRLGGYLIIIAATAYVSRKIR